MALRWSAFVVAACAACATPVLGQQTGEPPPPTEAQILRIEPGMHTAPIFRIGVDAACSLIATGSDDKTVRLWHLPAARAGGPEIRPQFLRALRPPIGVGDEGKIYAVSVAPDGRSVAVGFWAQTGGDNRVHIYETTSARLIFRSAILPGGIGHLAYSDDGHRLVTTLLAGHGYRMWDTATWRQVAEDANYVGEDSYGASFDGRGNLFTVSYDGQLRRYGPDGRLQGKAKTIGGQRPYSVAANRAGDRVAVGYNDTTAVEVYDGRSLKRAFVADPAPGSSGSISSVAWSADGQRLYGGGRYRVGDQRPIRVWEDSGRGKGRDLSVGPRDTVLHLLPCAGGIAYASGDPFFGLLDARGERQLWKGSVVPDMRDKLAGNFTVSADGTRVRFSVKKLGTPAVLFDLASEQLSDSEQSADGLTAADTTSLKVTDWQDRNAPKIDGKRIVISQHELSRSLAIAPDRRFVLGADWRLRAFDKDGGKLWDRAVPSAAWGLNIPASGKVAVVAYGDGTIRWHRMEDGEELLALFLHEDDRRWVAWTPRGYYMASPGAESLIGWHVNRGWNKVADFFPAERFRVDFNRPDIVKMVLVSLDETKAIEEANRRARLQRAVEDVRAAAPPVVIIQKPENNAAFRSQEVTLEYYAISPTGKRITDIDVRINNASLGARAAVPLSRDGNAPIRLTLTLPREDVTITLVAREGAKASEPVALRLRWDGAKPGQVELPRLRALFVGVNEYESPNLKKLKYASKDATDLASFFKAQAGKSYSKVEVRLLPDARRADVLDGLEWLEKGSEEGDVNLLFLAGHGVTDDQQHFYYLAADSDPEKPRATGVSRDEVLRTIRNRKGSMVVMLDTCHSAASADASAPAASRVDMNRLANELGDKTLGVFLYASALGRQFSFEHPDWQNGAFTKALLEGLAGAADREKLGYVETDELAVYVRRRVLRMTDGRQEPVRMKPDAAPEMRLVSLP